MQDEATELTGGLAKGGSAEKGLALLAQHCNIAAVTLGEKGCLAQQQGEEAFSEPAAKDVKVVDATGLIASLHAMRILNRAAVVCYTTSKIDWELGWRKVPRNTGDNP